MSLYKLHDVTLGDIEAQGYAFKKKTAFGDARRGVVFVDDESILENLPQDDVLTFSGPCYYRKRGPRDREFDVAIIQTIPTRMGHRIDFEAIDNPDPVRRTDVEVEA